MNQPSFSSAGPVAAISAGSAPPALHGPAAGECERNESQVRRRLLECGLQAVTEQGTESDLTTRVTGLSGFSPETLHSHFADSDGLLRAVAQGLSNELVGIIERSAGDFVDPAKRIACGVRMYLNTASEYPVFAKLIVKAGLDVAGPRSLVGEYLPAHIAYGLRSGRFGDEAAIGGTDLVSGTTFAAVTRIASGAVPDGYSEQVATVILRGMGVPGMQAYRLAIVVPPRVQPWAGSLLARARAMH